MVGGFKPCIGLDADSSEPGACFRFCVSLSFSASLQLTFCLSLCVSKINIKNIYKNKNKLKKKRIRFPQEVELACYKDMSNMAKWPVTVRRAQQFEWSRIFAYTSHRRKIIEPY